MLFTYWWFFRMLTSHAWPSLYLKQESWSGILLILLPCRIYLIWSWLFTFTRRQRGKLNTLCEQQQTFKNGFWNQVLVIIRLRNCSGSTNIMGNTICSDTTNCVSQHIFNPFFSFRALSCRLRGNWLTGSTGKEKDHRKLQNLISKLLWNLCTDEMHFLERKTSAIVQRSWKSGSSTGSFSLTKIPQSTNLTNCL
jgi:hypothetical protein